MKSKQRDLGRIREDVLEGVICSLRSPPLKRTGQDRGRGDTGRQKSRGEGSEKGQRWQRAGAEGSLGWRGGCQGGVSRREPANPSSQVCILKAMRRAGKVSAVKEQLLVQLTNNDWAPTMCQRKF